MPEVAGSHYRRGSDTRVSLREDGVSVFVLQNENLCAREAVFAPDRVYGGGGGSRCATPAVQVDSPWISLPVLISADAL